MHQVSLGASRRIGWLLVGSLTVITASWGLAHPTVYVDLIAPATRPGALSQDLISVIVGLILCGLALARPAAGTRAELVGLGLLGYLVYGYGIYAIERVYNAWYLN